MNTPHKQTLIFVTGGGVWGLSLAHTLSVTLHAAVFFGWQGALGCAIGGSILAWLLQKSLAPAGGWALYLPLADLLNKDTSSWRGAALLLASLLLLIGTGTGEPHTRRRGTALALLIPLLVYLPDLSPYVGRADTFEFQVVAPRLGIAHPSGYPLYILIGKLFSLLPLGTSAWRVNLSSAVFASLAAGTLYLALTEEEYARFDLTLIPAYTLAFSPTLWSRAIEAEVYALNAFLVTLALWLSMRFVTGKVPVHRALPWLGTLTGLGVASHLTLGAMACFALPMLTARPSRRTWLITLGLGLSGLLLYLYIPARWPAITGSWMPPRQFIDFVTNAESGGALHPLAFVQDPSRWVLIFRLLRTQIGWVGLLTSLIGVFVAQGEHTLRHAAFRLAMILAFCAWVWFNLSFYVADPDYSSFLIPAHVMLIFWLGQGLNSIAIRIPSRLYPVFLVSLSLLPLSRLWITGPTLDTISQGRQDEAWGRYALQQPLATGAAILADSEKFPPLYYLQQVEHIRPDLDLVTAFNEEQYRQILGARLEAGQRVYLARYLPGVDVYGVSSVGPLVEVRPPTLPFTPTQVEAQLPPLLLARHKLNPDPLGRPLHHLTLVWHVTVPLTQDLEMHVRLLKADGSPAWEAQPTRPVAGYSATPSWRAGQTVADYHALRWPDWLPPGSYPLQVGVAIRFAEPTRWATIDKLTIFPRATKALARHIGARYGIDTWLTGVDYPDTVWAAAPLPLDLTWQSPKPSPVRISWNQGTQTILTETVAATSWQRQRVTLHAPDAPGTYRLEIAQLTETGQPLPAQCAWLSPQRHSCPLGDITVGPSNAGLANFDNQIVLVEAALNAHNVPAGGQLVVRLTWRGLRAMEQDYTVFVQVLDTKGHLYGQVDSWPIQGARPTHSWQAGETLDDEYRFYLHPDTPTGNYQVIVGWYLLADMHRLPLLNRQGRIIGDAYTVGTFTLP